MANRFWVGGTASWDATAGTKWATTSGGAGGAAVPTNADDVFFDAASGAVTCTIATGGGTCKSLTCTGFTGTLAGTATLTVFGNITLVAGMTYSATSPITIAGICTITSAGKTVGAVTVQNSTDAFLGDALTSSGTLTLSSGTFTTNNYNVTASSLSSSNSNTRTINLGSSTVTLTLASSNAVNFSTSTGLTFNAGTSQIILTNTSPSILGGGAAFYNVSYTSAAIATPSITGANTFNNLSFAGRTSTGIAQISIAADQIINGTLTLSAGTNATMRTFVRSDTIGTTRTLTCAAVASLQDIDFRDITIAGAAAPVSGTRLGNCKGNSGITFDAAKTVYWGATSSGNWGAALWAPSIGGTASAVNFPLAQDAAVFPSAYPFTFTTVTINAAYNIGTIDMSARTSNTMTLAVGSTTPAIYGNWINGTGTTLTGTGALTFAGRGSQTITSAGKTFTQPFTINSPSGSVTLQDAFATSIISSSALVVSQGTFDATSYNVSVTAGSAQSIGTLTRAINFGSGTWTIASGWTASGSNLTVTGTGTISMTSASAKTFAGGGIQTYPTLNQGGAGTLTVSGSNKFAGLTNTAIGSIQFTGGTTNEFTSFSINGISGNLLQLGSTNTTQAILKKPTAWNVGANSTDAGNNTGLSFTAGGNDYLSVSYINGQFTSSVVTHITTGALPGLTALIAGTSSRFRTFGTSGALTGPGAQILGLANRYHVFTSSGSLVGPGARVVGSSTRFRVYDTSGVLTGQGSLVAGASLRFRAFVASGNLTGPGTVVTGTVSRFRAFDTTGDLPGLTSIVTGEALRTTFHDAVGALVAAGADVTGQTVHISLYPDPSNVREGVQYGPGGIYVGTLTVNEGQTIIRLRSFTERL